MNHAKRLFVGIPVMGRLASKLGEVQQSQLQLEGVNWVKQENFHITICFIGETDREKEITDQLGIFTASTSAFKLTFEKICIMPEFNPRMVWAKFHYDRIFSNLVSDLHLVLAPDQKNTKSPIPHITLARFKPKSQWKEIDCHLEDPPTVMEVDQMVLWESVFENDGVNYYPVKKYSLQGTVK